MKNIITILKDFFKSIFIKKDKLIDGAKIVQESGQTYSKSKDSYFDEMRSESEKRNHLLNLKKRFENEEISESQISEEDKKGIEGLYYEQIQSLNRKIRNAKKESHGC